MIRCSYCGRGVEAEFADIKVCKLCANARNVIDKMLANLQVQDSESVAEALMQAIHDQQLAFVWNTGGER